MNFQDKIKPKAKNINTKKPEYLYNIISQVKRDVCTIFDVFITSFAFFDGSACHELSDTVKAYTHIVNVSLIHTSSTSTLYQHSCCVKLSVTLKEKNIIPFTI
jgi:hypothetical protein